MKGIVFEIKNKKAVALSSEGRFVNFKNKGYTVGEEIELGNENRTLSYRKFAMIAATFLIVLILAAGGIFGGIYYDANLKTSYTVQMDINPSVTIYLNSKDIVIKAEGNNLDGAALNPIDLKGETLDTFISKYIERFVESDMFDTGAEYTVKIAVDGRTKKTADTKAISEKVESIVRKDFEDKGIPVVTETENGIKEAETKQSEPTEFTYSFYNKLLSETALSSGKVYDGDILYKLGNSPTSGDSGYTFAFWWDSIAKEDSGAPVDFFANGDRSISTDTYLFAVWKFKDGYTVDGKTWLIEPTMWTYSFYNKLLSETALSSGKVYDGDTLSKSGDSPSPGDSGYTYAFWWDGEAIEDSGTPVDFFANGNRTISEDTQLFAVWKTDADGYTVDGINWLKKPASVNIQFVLVYPNEAAEDEVLYKGDVSSFEEMVSKMPIASALYDKLKDAGLNSSNYYFNFWSLSAEGTTGDYFVNEKELVANVVLYAVFK